LKIRKHSAARAVLKALRRGETVGISFDQNAKHSEAVFVLFFNETAATPSGLARLAALSGASVVPVFIIRQPDMRSHRIEIGDEVAIQRSEDAKGDIEENTRRFVRPIEDIVRVIRNSSYGRIGDFESGRGMAAIYPSGSQSKELNDPCVSACPLPQKTRGRYTKPQLDQLMESCGSERKPSLAVGPDVGRKRPWRSAPKAAHPASRL
jgi:hypothetical protein